MRHVSTKLHCKDADEWTQQKVSRIREEGGFDERFSFWLSDSPKNAKRRYYWKYRCPKCSSDEYVTKGLCDGVFESAESVLLQGQLSCRCSKVYRWTKEQRRYCIEKYLSDNHLAFNFVDWVGEYRHSGSKFLLKCSEHLPWETDFGRLGNKFGCPHCAKSGFKAHEPGCFYVLRAINDETSHDFTGFGVTGDLDSRLSVHKRKLRKRGYRIVDLEYFNFQQGQRALDIERSIKRNFEIQNTGIEGFMSEATYSYNYDNILSWVDKVLDSAA